MRRAIRPSPLEFDQHLPVRGQSESVRSDGRAERIPAHPLEPVPATGADAEDGVEIETVLVRVTRSWCRGLDLLGRVAAPADTPPGPGTERQQALDRGRVHPR